MKASRLPVNALLPPDSTLIKISKKGNLAPNLPDFIKQIEAQQFVVVVPAQETDTNKLTPVGAYEEQIAISNYNLSSLCVCSRVCFAFEEIWGIL